MLKLRRFRPLSRQTAFFHPRYFFPTSLYLCLIVLQIFTSNGRRGFPVLPSHRCTRYSQADEAIDPSTSLPGISTMIHRDLSMLNIGSAYTLVGNEVTIVNNGGRPWKQLCSSTATQGLLLIIMMMMMMMMMMYKSQIKPYNTVIFYGCLMPHLHLIRVAQIYMYPVLATKLSSRLHVSTCILE